MLLIKFTNQQQPAFELWHNFTMPVHLADIFSTFKPDIVALDFRLVSVLKPINPVDDLPPQPYCILQKQSDEATFLELMSPTDTLTPNNFNSAFNQQLETSHELWLSAQTVPASKLNRLIIALILLCTPVMLIVGSFFMWNYL
ncbi:hypothetical protein ACGTJS_09955 [Faucicola mancuniensis]|uniref:hypothetical protein n=1 Tax=Faucicola mancuniensis TaxID=1309795 RepID=UPI0028EBDA20|nr:hypothetical protein [uncultured Moraxella sp.]